MKKFIFIFAIALKLFALKQDENIIFDKLENGLEYYIQENANPKNIGYFYLLVNAGSTDEAANERGLAHFVEHMAFNGSRDFSKNDMIKQLESLGVRFGADLNAQTGYDTTTYNLEIQISDENLKDVFRVFNNWIDGINFDKDELEKERGVILEEERQRNTPKYRLFKQQSKNIFADSIYFNKSPIGETDIIKNVDVATIKSFYERVYQPRNMKFIAVGDFNKSKIKELIRLNFSKAKNTNSYKSPDKTIPQKTGFEIYNYDTKELGIDSINLTFVDKYTPRTDEKTARKILLDSYISSLIRLYYEKKSSKTNIDVNFIRPLLQNQKVLYTFGSNVINNDFNASLVEILNLKDGIKKYGFSQDEFQIIKKNFLNSFENSYKNSKNKKSKNIAQNIALSIENGSTLVSDKDNFELNTKLANEISLDEVLDEFNRILNLSQIELNIFSANGFKLNKNEFEKLSKNIEPYNLNELSKTLPKNILNSEPTPKKIISKEHFKKQDIYVYRLENNATLVLKQLKSNKNKILFSAISKGGTSNLKDPKLGSFAVQVSNLSGAGEFNNYEIAKILSGKSISYEKSIDSLTQGYYGSSSSDDLKYLLQIINLEFNLPKLDQNILENVKTKTIDQITKNKELDEYKFTHEFIDFTYDNNPRTRQIQIQDVKNLNLDELKNIVHDKFTNAASFTFIIVGDFEIKDIENLAKRYIATLPTHAKVENFIDDKVRSLNGVHKFKRTYQNSDRTDVSINIKNENTSYSLEQSIKLRALNYILRTMLREKIREQKGQTYGFNTRISLSKDPFEHSNAIISFTCDPQNLNDVINGVRLTINELQNNGAKEQELQNYKKTAIINIKKSREQTDFWTKNIVSHFVFKNDLFDEEWFENSINNITNDDIKNAAKIYLNYKENEIISINNPKIKK